jgi:enterobactin synthetase component D
LPAEAELALSHKGYRQGQFVGGRLALRRACEQLGEQPPAIVSTARGAPTVGERLVGSISHKRTLAIGLAARSGQGSLGVDLEDYGPPRLGIAGHVLREAELEHLHQLPEARRWIALLLRFSVKEAVYKALDPYVQRYVAYHEAEVTPDLEGGAKVTLHLAHGEGPFDVDARYAWLHGRLITSVRIQPVLPNA